MPPDLTAGPASLAGPPPGVPGKPATGPPGGDALSASLFASLLMQGSGSPPLPALPPGSAAKQPIDQALPPMDTFSGFSFLSKEKAPVSELTPAKKEKLQAPADAPAAFFGVFAPPNLVSPIPAAPAPGSPAAQAPGAAPSIHGQSEAAATVLPLPGTFALTVPESTPALLPKLAATDTPANLPNVLGPGTADLAPVSLPLQAVPTVLSTAAQAAVTEGVVTPQAIGVPGKITEAPAKNGLKSAGVSADTYTRTSALARNAADAKAVSNSEIVFKAGLLEPTKRDETEASPSQTEAVALTGMSALTATSDAVKLDAGPLSTADRAEMVRQVAAGVGVMPLPTKAGAAEQMTLQLHPKDWGQLQVSVTVTPGTDAGAAKTVVAHLTAETPQIKAALESQGGALHQALKSAGLQLDHLTVSVKLPEARLLEGKVTPGGASAGMSFGQGQPETRGQSQYFSGQSAFGQASAFANFAGGFQQGRQGQQAPAHHTALPEQEQEVASVQSVGPRLARGRLDTQA